VSVVTVRPLRGSDLSYFDLWGTPDVDSFNFFGFRMPHRARAAFAGDLLARTRRCDGPARYETSLAEFGGSVAGQREGQIEPGHHCVE
jgi:hypothetical protein